MCLAGRVYGPFRSPACSGQRRKTENGSECRTLVERPVCKRGRKPGQVWLTITLTPLLLDPRLHPATEPIGVTFFFRVVSENRENEMSDKSTSDGGARSPAAEVTISEAVKSISDNLGGVARAAALNLAETPKTASADALEGMGRAVRSAADDIGKESPVVAGYVRDAAANIDKVAGGLRDHTVGDLFDMVTKFGRQQPVAFFAGAIVAGFALSRFVKSGMNEPTAEETPQRGHDVGRMGV